MKLQSSISNMMRRVFGRRVGPTQAVPDVYQSNQRFHHLRNHRPANLSPEALSTLVVLVHIAKSGGTTLKNLMTYNYGAFYQDFHPRLNNLHDRVDVIGEIRALSAHMPLGYHERLRTFLRERSGATALPFLTARPVIVSSTRDPVSRLVSTYNFVTTFPAHALHAETRAMDPEEFFRYLIDKRPQEVGNLQCWFLAGVPDADFALARSAAETRFDMVVDIAQQRRLVDLFVERLGWRVPEKFDKSNESPKKLRERDLPSKMRRRLEALTEEDRKLADFIRERSAQ